MSNSEKLVRRLAIELGATLSVSFDCIEVDLPVTGPTFVYSETHSLIISRETGETTVSMWRAMAWQIKDGLSTERGAT